MPDIDPAALSRPAVSLSTPTMAAKTLAMGASGGALKKASQIIPPRIDLEPYYAAVRAFVPNDKWALYKETLCNLAYGRLNQAEYSAIVDPLVTSASGEREHHHNRLVLAILANVTREMPDSPVAPWVGADDKPPVPAGSKPVSGDAAERRLKVGVMQLPAKDRRRIKEMAQNDVGTLALALYHLNLLLTLPSLTPKKASSTSLPTCDADRLPPPKCRRVRRRASTT